MLNNFWIIIRLAFVTVVHSIRSVQAIKKHGTEVYYQLARKWSKKLIKIIDVKIQVIGIEHLDKNSSYLFVANHGSYFDIPILIDALPFDFNIIYKESLEKTPIFGKSLKESPFLSIDRTSPRKSIKTIISTKESFLSGKSILIFPEGTRSKTGETGEFKSGALKIASINKKQIVPVSIKGSYEILPIGERQIRTSQQVTVTISKPVDFDKDSNFNESLRAIINNGLK